MATLVYVASLQDIAALHERFAHEMSLTCPDESRLIAVNKELHFAIYSQAHMPMLLQMIESLWLRIGPILNNDMRSGSARVTERIAVDHHARLVAALKKKDAAAAAKALRGDIESAAEFIVSAGVLVAADAAPAASASAILAKGIKRTRRALERSRS